MADMEKMEKIETTGLVDKFYDAADILSCVLPNTPELGELFGFAADPSQTISSVPTPSFDGPGGGMG